MRKKKKELEVYMLASTKDLINQEAHVGIKHVEAYLQLDHETEELKVEDSRLGDIITLLKAHLKISRTILFKSFIYICSIKFMS